MPVNMKLKLARNVFLLLAVSSIVAIGCASVGGDHNYRRLGETTLVSTSMVGVSNAVVRWAGTLTNGYSLLCDAEARHSYVGLVFKDDPRVVFMLLNEKDSVAPWGRSACQKRGQGLFYATIIIRLQALNEGTKIAVAVHESQVTDRIGFNVHTGFERGRNIDLAPCSADERAVISELELRLQQGGTANPPAIPDKP
jgi:hypothetical protein